MGTDKAKAQGTDRVYLRTACSIGRKIAEKISYLQSTVDSKNLAGIDEIADKAIGKTLSDAKYAGAVLTDAKALKGLEAAEGVVLIENYLPQHTMILRRSFQLCKRLNVPVVGCIVVR